MEFYSDDSKYMNREYLFSIMKKYELPYVEVTIHGDYMDRNTSPIGKLSDTFEILINTLLGDIIVTASLDAGNMLNFLQTQLESTMQLSNLIMNDPKRVEDLHKRMRDLLKEHEKHTKEEPRTPIPSVFEDAFKDEPLEESS